MKRPLVLAVPHMPTNPVGIGINPGDGITTAIAR